MLRRGSPGCQFKPCKSHATRDKYCDEHFQMFVSEVEGMHSVRKGFLQRRRTYGLGWVKCYVDVLYDPQRRLPARLMYWATKADRVALKPYRGAIPFDCASAVYQSSDCKEMFIFEMNCGVKFYWRSRTQKTATRWAKTFILAQKHRAKLEYKILLTKAQMSVAYWKPGFWPKQVVQPEEPETDQQKEMRAKREALSDSIGPGDGHEARAASSSAHHASPDPLPKERGEGQADVAPEKVLRPAQHKAPRVLLGQLPQKDHSFHASQLSLFDNVQTQKLNRSRVRQRRFSHDVPTSKKAAASRGGGGGNAKGKDTDRGKAVWFGRWRGAKGHEAELREPIVGAADSSSDDSDEPFDS